MTLVVQDATGSDDANAYVSLSDCATYCTDRGLTFAETNDGEAAIIRATAAIDATYSGRFGGYRINGRGQSTEWPRTLAYDSEGWLIEGIPVEIVNATCEAAVRELATPGSMMPDLERGGRIQMLKAGSVEIQYAGNADAVTSFQLIDGILAPILETGSAGGLFGIASRG